MEPVVKLEKCDDDEEFQSITIEETQLSEVNLSQDSNLIAENILKRSYSTMMECTSSTLIADANSEALPSEAKRPTPPEKTSGIHCSEMLDANLIYSPPFFIIVNQLGPDKAIYIVRCCSCGRLMKSSATHPLKLILHMRKFHHEITNLYEEHKLDHLQNTNSPNMLSFATAGTSNNYSSVEVNKNSSKDDNNRLEANAGTVQNENNTGDFVIEIIDDEVNGHRVKNEPTSNQTEFSTATVKKLSNVINQRLEKFVRENGFKELSNKVDELLSISTKNDSSSYSVIKELKSELNNLKNECQALRLAVLQTQASKRELQDKLQKMENFLQQRKLIIKNINISNRQQPQKDVEKLFKDSLSLDNISIVNCSIIPGSKNSDSSKTSTSTENISVELLQAKDCKLVLRQMHKIKNTGIFIEQELTPLQRKRRNKLMILRKELLSLKSDLKILVRNTTLVVNGKKFYWDDTDGLYHDDSEAMQATGVEYLKSITGLDLKEFISVLLKYDINAKKK